MKTSIKTLAALALSAIICTATAAESVSVADLHAQRTDLSGKQVSITGKVIKVNNGIMRRNFIHVQDDTSAGEFDRVIFTSQQTTQVGKTVTATGTVKLDTDFGMGYFYPTLVEESTLTTTE
ncbi:MAG: hypothetical protein V7752_00915 [Halopseudomonas sp.]